MVIHIHPSLSHKGTNLHILGPLASFFPNKVPVDMMDLWWYFNGWVEGKNCRKQRFWPSNVEDSVPFCTKYGSFSSNRGHLSALHGTPWHLRTSISQSAPISAAHTPCNCVIHIHAGGFVAINSTENPPIPPLPNGTYWIDSFWLPWKTMKNLYHLKYLILFLTFLRNQQPSFRGYHPNSSLLWKTRGATPWVLRDLEECTPYPPRRSPGKFPLAAENSIRNWVIT